ncbi:Nicotinamide N-methyltransferase-like protein [Artemisia annua]|uniref:Nicotinamide N-methyltransferase-like protein n=1 Tax=Artemisia annua TaxID=35608 RepID=A0A2U1M6K9_ARTAN|nr:Nicotinamide N-methyltransferase-like protein [Artemisia annua]
MRESLNIMRLSLKSFSRWWCLKDFTVIPLALLHNLATLACIIYVVFRSFTCLPYASCLYGSADQLNIPEAEPISTITTETFGKYCTSHPHGVVYMAAKKYYFGVRGGSRHFISLFEKDGGLFLHLLILKITTQGDFSTEWTRVLILGFETKKLIGNHPIRIY